MHGKALKVADVGGAPAHRIAGHVAGIAAVVALAATGIVEDAEPHRRRRAERLVEPVGAERPERVEGQTVDAEHGGTVAAAGAAKVAGRSRADLGNRREIVPQHVEAFLHLEPGAVEHVGVVGPQRGGDRPAESLLVGVARRTARPTRGS